VATDAKRGNVMQQLTHVALMRNINFEVDEHILFFLKLFLCNKNNSAMITLAK
jgi:hypothetical protein